MLRWWRRRKAPKAMETRALPGPDYGAASGCPRLSDGDVVPVNGVSRTVRTARRRSSSAR